MKQFTRFAVIGILLVAAFIHVLNKVGTTRAPNRESLQPGDASSNQAALASAAGLPPTNPISAAIPRSLATNQPTAYVPANSPAPRESKRAWDTQFLASLDNSSVGDAIRFELVGGEQAEGTIRYMNHQAGELIYVTGELTAPEAGRFFFQKQTMPGKAGQFVGVVELPASQRAFRIEPTGANGAPELVSRHLGEVICLNMPLPGEAMIKAPEEIPPLNPSTYPANLPIPPYQNGIIILQSKPGADAVIYLDFQGGYTPTWGGIAYEKPVVNNSQIFDVWKRVAERYEPFQVNITTDLGVFQSAPQISRQRCIITPTSTAAPGAGGVSYIGSFQNGGIPDTPNWVFMVSGKACAEAIAHECGHAFGLGHDGQEINQTNHVEYYGGQGTGATGWAPIMGVGYSQPVVQWSKGEYQWANNKQDDMAIISGNNNMQYRVDDAGDTLATSRYLEVYTNSTAFAEGVIETDSDTDAFQFTTTGGAISLTASPVGDWGGLAIKATLRDASDTIIASNNPQNLDSATIQANLRAGTYTFCVTGAGRNNPFTTGFSSYASVGYYSVAGTVTNARLPSRFTIPENIPVGARLGILAANNPDGAPLSFTISSGNIGGAFTIDADGSLLVADSTPIDYELLARPTQLPVQFEMFVDIVNASTLQLIESNRRVVVAVTNVNEAPTLTGFTNSILEHTMPGTLAGSVIGTDPDFFTLLSYSIIGGNSNNMFTISDQTGAISVAGDLVAATQSVYNLVIKVSDQTLPSPLTATTIVTLTVMRNSSAFRPGSISYAVYTNVNGNLLSALTTSPTYPYNPALEKQMPSFEGDVNRGNNYGAVMRGYLIPPFTGIYTFWIATDDNGELWLSSTTNTTGMTRRAYITGDGNAAGWREWDKFPSQQSAPISLIAGQAYYIEGRMKQGGGADGFSVAWRCDTAGIERDVISARYLAPYKMNYVPRITGFTASLHKDAIIGSRVGTPVVTDVNENDAHFFSIANGNSSGIFAIDSSSGVLRVANETALQASVPATYNLSINVVDDGAPARSATATVTFKVVATNVITSTSVRQEIWTNIGSATAVSALTSAGGYPKRPNSLRAFTEFSSGSKPFADNYGTRIRAWLTAPASGVYTFFLSSDDNSQLKFTSTTNPLAATVIASVSDFSDYAKWDKFASQKSAPISLVSGQKYYLETLHKEGGGGDHIEVGWVRPGVIGTNIIAGSFLSPVDIGFAPDLSSRSVVVNVSATNGTVIATMTASTSLLNPVAYKIVSGNTNNTFAIDPDNGQLSVRDNALIAGRLVPGFVIGVQAQNSGYGDIYPRKSVTAMVTVQFAETSAFVWSGNGTNNNWSQSANWNGTVPVESSLLVFGGTNRQTNVNDLLSLAGPVTFANGGFSVTGNPLILRAGLASVGDNTWAIDSTLNQPQTISSTTGTLIFSGALNNAGNLLKFQADGALQVDGVISGTGGLTKNGSDKLVLAAANTFTGPVTVSAGTMTLVSEGSVAYSSSVDVLNGATLGSATRPLTIPAGQVLAGSGVVLGDVLVAGALSPGDSLGVLSFGNALTLRGTTIIEIARNGLAVTNDRVVVAGTMNYGGAMIVTNIGSDLAAGDVFDVFDAASFSGEFQTYVLAPLSPGLVWNTAFLPVDGTLRVMSAAAPHIQQVSFADGALSLQVQSVTGVKYVLQCASSLVPPVVWSNISTNSGTGDTLIFSAPSDVSRSQQFYRIATF